MISCLRLLDFLKLIIRKKRTKRKLIFDILNYMVIFIDESGTHKQSGHASTAIVYIQIPNVKKVETSILDIEKELKIQSFHWGEERWQVRNKFLSRIINLDFTIKVAIFENPVHPEKMVELIFRHLITEENINQVFIDGEKPKWYENRLKKVLRDKGISIKKLRTVRSTSSPGIQLADCIAGLIRRFYERPDDPDPKRWHSKLKREKKLVAEFLFDTKASEIFLPKQ